MSSGVSNKRPTPANLNNKKIVNLEAPEADPHPTKEEFEEQQARMHELNSVNMVETGVAVRKVDFLAHKEVLAELAEAQKELEFAKGQLNDIRIILNNPWHNMGPYVNSSPIKRIVDKAYDEG